MRDGESEAPEGVSAKGESQFTPIGDEPAMQSGQDCSLELEIGLITGEREEVTIRPDGTCDVRRTKLKKGAFRLKSRVTPIVVIGGALLLLALVAPEQLEPFAEAIKNVMFRPPP